MIKMKKESENTDRIEKKAENREHQAFLIAGCLAAALK
jgi:hypothetical protein